MAMLSKLSALSLTFWRKRQAREGLLPVKSLVTEDERTARSEEAPPTESGYAKVEKAAHCQLKIIAYSNTLRKNNLC